MTLSYLYELDNHLFTFLFEPRNHVETAAALTNQLVITLFCTRTSAKKCNQQLIG